MSDEVKKGFTFFRSYYEAASALPDKHRLSLYDAIVKYALDNETSPLTKVAQPLFTLIVPTLNKSKVRAASGAEGGRSKSEANSKQNESKSEANEKQTASDKSDDKGLRIKDIGLRIIDEDISPSNPPQGESENAAQRIEIIPFDIFWSLYPKKVGKKNAQKAYERISPDAVLQAKIIETLKVERCSDGWAREDGRFIPSPASWLNSGGWDNEPVETWKLDRERRNNTLEGVYNP